MEGLIISATCPVGGSFTFRSILHGRDLLWEGLIWRIGNGKSIKIHHDNWIPRKGSLWPMGQEYIQGVTHVKDLLTVHGNSWDSSKTEQMFSPDDAQDILQIAIGGPEVEDYLAWNYTKIGQFTVRSAYNLRMSINRAKTGRPGSSSMVADQL